MRIASPILLMALAAMSMSQTLPERVTYQGRAERVPRLLENWSADFKMKLEAAPQFANEVVLVDVKDQPTDVVMKHLGTVTGGRWEKNAAGVYRLVVDNEARTTRDREVIAARLKTIRKQIADQIKPEPAGAETTEEPAMAFMGGGSNKQIYRILAEMDLTPVARMKPGDRIVFSTSPTRLQRPLPPNSNRYIADYIKVRNAGISAQPDTSESPEMTSMMAMMPPGYKEMMARERRPIKDYAKALLVIGSDARMGNQQAELRIYDSAGNVVGSSQASIDASYLSSMMEEMKDFSGDAKPTEDMSAPVEYSADTKAFAATRPSFGQNTRTVGKPLNPDVKTRILDVVNLDPLALAVSDELLSFAKSEKKPIIASLTDDSNGMFASFFSKLDATVGSVKKDLESGSIHELIKNDEFILVRPSDPESSRAIRTDRASLAKLLQSASPEGLVRLNDLAAFAANNPDCRNGTAVSVYLTYFAPGVSSGVFGQGADWQALKFYNRINPIVGGRLVKNEAVALSSFDSRPVDVMVYGQTPKLIVERGKPASKIGFLDMIYQSMGSMGGMGGTDYKDEPTEVLAAGFPADSNVSVAVHTEPFLTVGPGETSEIGMGSMGLDEMAVIQFMMSQKEFGAAMSASMPKMPKMKQGERTIYEFTIRLGEGLYVKQTLMDQVLPKDARVVEFNKYPADLQQLLNSRIEELKKSPMANIFGMMGAFGKGSQPPP